MSAARTLGLVKHASGFTPSAFSASPAFFACFLPFFVSLRSASGEPSAASACRSSQIMRRL